MARHRRLLALLLLALAMGGCESDDSPLPAVGTLERDRIALVAEANEPIVDIAVTEGASLEMDQLIMQLDTANHDAQLAGAQAALRRTEQRLAELIRGPRHERIVEAQARVDGARENLAAQRREYGRVETLVADNLLSPSALDAAYARRELAEADFEESQAVLDELLEGTTPEELGQAQAAVEEASAAIDSLRISSDRLSVRAPRPGIVEVLPYEVGERPPRGATVALLLADSAPYARIYVPEPIRVRIVPGLEAVIRVDGVEQDFAGTVRFVSSDAAFTPYFALTQRDRSRLSFLAEVTVNGPTAAELPTGLPVEVDFPSLAE